MSLEILGPTVRNRDDAPEPLLPHSTHEQPTQANPGNSPKTSRVLWVIALAGFVLGAAAMTLSLDQRASIAPADAVPSAVARGAPAGAAGLAEIFVTTYLTHGGAPGALARFGIDDALVAGMIPERRYVTHVATVDVAQQSAGKRRSLGGHSRRGEPGSGERGWLHTGTTELVRRHN